MAYPRNAFLRLWETRFHREFTTGAREAALAAGVDPNSAMGGVIQDSVTAKCLIEAVRGGAADDACDLSLSTAIERAVAAGNPLADVTLWLAEVVPPLLLQWCFKGREEPPTIEEEKELRVLGKLLGVRGLKLFVFVQQWLYDPLQRVFSFSTPTEDALECLAKLGPLVELGAGTGYWAAMLARRGVNIVAFDIAPPSVDTATGNMPNYFFERQFFPVLAGGPEVLKSQPHGRALLLVWPFHMDLHRKHLAQGQGTTEPWDARALRAFRGDVLVHVGHLSECGVVDTSREFVALLRERFDEHERLPLLHPSCQEALTVWRRKLRARAEPCRSGTCIAEVSAPAPATQGRLARGPTRGDTSVSFAGIDCRRCSCYAARHRLCYPQVMCSSTAALALVLPEAVVPL